MSKEIAQTIGGKRVWLLVALLAAIASLATLASSWTQASAASATPGDVRLDQADQQVGNEYPLVLRHVDDAGNIIEDQDVNFNVVGSRHTVCIFEYDDENGEYYAFDAGNIPTSFIDFENAGGPGGPPNSVSVLSFVAEVSDFPFGEEYGADAEGASCFSWISTGAGDQQITLEVFVEESDGIGPAAFQIGWDYEGAGNRSIIKEWNQLEDSEIFIDESSQGDEQNVKISRQLWQLPNGDWVLPAPVEIQDIFHGSHIETNGTYDTRTAGTSLVGVLWTVSLSGCGYLESNVYPGSSDVSGDPNEYAGDDVDGPGDSVSGQTILWEDDGGAETANYPDYDFYSDGCRPGSKAVITITGTEPGPQGSSAGDTITETIEISFTAPLDQKRVLLAWAGQRVVLEVDWRLPPGDTGATDPDALGFCPFGLEPTGSTVAQSQFFGIINYKRLAGTGGFVPGLGAIILGNDAWVVLNGDTEQDGDAPWYPQDACISRVLYENEQPGQEDIQVSWDPFFDIELQQPVSSGQVNTTKVDIVIYYMKFESVTASLVTSVEKPSHNASGYDYAPGNPWDSRSDVTSTDWNVSKDLLVRFQVRGWFVNENPSGREQDYNEDADEFLPANRWVLPDDWARLAGGPRDPEDGRATGTAESTRPHYDLLFDPLSSCPTLDTPTGGVRVVGTNCPVASSLPFVGPYTIVELPTLDVSGSISVFGGVYDNMYPNGDVNRWDAPMPVAELWVKIRGTGFIKEVLKQDVYYTGTVDDASLQDYNNPYYATHIPPSPYMEFAIKGGGYFWDTWGIDGLGTQGDGPYTFWVPVVIGTSPLGAADSTVTPAQATELQAIRDAYDDQTIARDLVIYTDNHGEGMVTANGDFKLDLAACETNLLEGGKRCNPGDNVGTGSISAVVDYPDITGKHPAVESNTVSVDWIWGGYKDVKVYDDPNGLPQIKYIVFHAVDRDGFCDPADFHPAAVSLHPVLSGHENDEFNGGPAETVDFLIDAGQGIITHSALNGQINLDGNRQFATGVKTFSTAGNDPATSGIIEFPHSRDGYDDECQAWVRISNSLLSMADFYVVAHNDEGRVGFDRVVDFQNTASYTLSFRWSLITWAGADNIPVEAALKGTGANDAGNDIFDQVTAVYGWNAQGQDWLGFFPAGVSVPGANDLTSLRTGSAYWIAIKAPGPVTWTIATNVGS